MARVLLAVLCRGTSVDRFRNHLSIFELIEGLDLASDDTDALAAANGTTTLDFPGLDLQFVTVFVRSDEDQPEEAVSRVVIRAPGGRAHVSSETTVNLIEHRLYRSLGAVGMLPLNGVGVYRIDVELKEGDEWRVAATYPVPVQFRPIAPPVKSEPSV